MKVASIERVLTLTNATGLHMRPAGHFVRTAARFKASIEVRYRDKAADAKRIVEVLRLGAAKGASLTVTATGEDAEQAISALEALVNSRFGETD